jgi:site-specific DNA recombinase
MVGAHGWRDSDKSEAGAREQALKQLKAERDQLQTRIETMYLDRLDGRISASFYDQMSTPRREQQKQIEARIAQLQTMKLRTATEAVQIIRSVSDGCGLFESQQPPQQRAIASALMQKRSGRPGRSSGSSKRRLIFWRTRTL